MFLICIEVEWAAGYAWSTDVGKNATTNGGRGHQQTENDGPTIAAHVKVRFTTCCTLSKRLIEF